MKSYLYRKALEQIRSRVQAEREVGIHTSWKKKKPPNRPHTTDRYDMAIAGAALANLRAYVMQICVPYPARPAR